MVKVRNWFSWTFISLSLVYFTISSYRLLITLTPDFSVYYTAALRLLHGTSVYTTQHVFTNFGYPPVSAVLFIPFTMFHYQLAQQVFYFFSVAALGTSIILSTQLLQIKLNPFVFLLTFSLAVLSFPVKFTFGMGQVNSIAYMLLLLGIFWDKKQKTLACVLCITLAIIAKPIFLFFLLYFIFAKKFRQLLFILGSLVIVSLMTVALFPLGYKDFLLYLFSQVPQLLQESGGSIYYNQSIASFFSRTVSLGLFAQVLAKASQLVLLGITVYVGVKVKNSLQVLVLLCIILPILDSYSWQHHFIVLLLPFIYTFFHTFRKKDIKLSFLTIASYMLVGWNIKNPIPLAHFPQNLLLSHVTYGTLLLLFVFLSLGVPKQKSLQHAKDP